MATYTIQILNNSGFTKSYVVFMEPPGVPGTSSGFQVFTNAWVTLNDLPPGGFDNIRYDDVVHAYWGKIDEPLGEGVRLRSGATVVVDPAERHAVPFSTKPPVGFGKVTPGKAANGCYAIVGAADFTAGDGFVFGLARPGRTALPVPVATFQAMPNETFNLAPTTKFFITSGVYEPGQVIHVPDDAQCAAIDFTGLPQSTATAIQEPDGSWVVTYS